MGWRDVPFAGGFLLTDIQLDAVAHFSKELLPGGWTFWSDEAVATEIAKDDHGNFALIRGEFVDLDGPNPAASSVAERLLQTLLVSPTTFMETLACIGGRYIVLTRHDGAMTLMNDALGMRSVYYVVESSVVGSHFHLVEGIIGSERALSTKAALPAMDLSPNPKIRHLLPNFQLVVSRWAIRRAFPYRVNPYIDETEQARIELLEELCHRYIGGYTEMFENMAISVTGGQDSRLMLALAQAHGAEITGFTYGIRDRSLLPAEDEWADSMQQDAAIVKKLLPFSSLREHHFIELADHLPRTVGAGDSDALRELIRANTWASHGHYLVPVFRNLFGQGDWVHLRGSGTEIGRRARTPALDTVEALAKRYGRAGGLDLLDDARRLGYGNGLHGYSRWDLAYWEIRMGKWHAEMMNEHDAAFSSFIPIGARRILEIFLSFSPERRREAYAVRELINRAAPVLNFIGTNDLRNLYEQQRDDAQLADEAAKVPETLRNVVVQGPQGATRSVSRASDALELPIDHFREGTRVSAVVFQAEEPSDVHFTVLNSYERSDAEGTFEWRILVDGRAVIACDGATQAIPTSVRIAGLPSGSTVKLELAALKDRAQKSWVMASRTAVFDLANNPTQGRLFQPLVGCDNPFATLLRAGDTQSGGVAHQEPSGLMERAMPDGSLDWD